MSRAPKEPPEKTESAGEPEPLRQMRPCPICGKLALRAFHPFCSKRCADVDLHRWLSGAYAIPGAEDEPPGEESGGSDAE